MINLYRLSKSQSSPVTLPDMSSLDAITRQLPDGYYSTFRTYAEGTHVIGLSAHLHRLPNVDALALRQSLRQLLEPYRPGEARVRVIETKEGQLYAAIEPLRPLPREVYEKGVRVETTHLRRKNPREKSTTFVSASGEERKHIAQEGIFEALLVKNNRILEGMTSNFFYVMGRDDSPPYVGTAQRDILLGVTRTMVIRAAQDRGVEVKYRAMKLSQLPAVQEAFITSSSRGIVPVIQIDDVPVGRGKVGPITKKLIRAYEADILKNSEAL